MKENIGLEDRAWKELVSGLVQKLESDLGSGLWWELQSGLRWKLRSELLNDEQ